MVVLRLSAFMGETPFGKSLQTANLCAGDSSLSVSD
jgi:hypothetical protein